MKVNMIDNTKNCIGKCVQIYLTKEESEDTNVKAIIEKYKGKGYKVGLFISGNEDYSDILKKIIKKQVELNRNV